MSCSAQSTKDDVPCFVRKFRSDSDEQCFHTYRELILGAHLRSDGWNLRYEQDVRGKSPDWGLLDDSGRVLEIIEVVTLHQRRAIEVGITKKVSSHETWTGWISTSPDRLYSKVHEKAEAYAALVQQVGVPYVIALFCEFTAPLEPQEVQHVLYDLYDGVFTRVPALSGLILFRERSGQYEYHFFANPDATRHSTIVGASDLS